jgi:hypothetical protein
MVYCDPSFFFWSVLLSLYDIPKKLHIYKLESWRISHFSGILVEDLCTDKIPEIN